VSDKLNKRARGLQKAGSLESENRRGQAVKAGTLVLALSKVLISASPANVAVSSAEVAKTSLTPKNLCRQHLKNQAR